MDGTTRIEIVDVTRVPAVSGNYPGPFKQIRYEVRNDGHIRFIIIKDLDLLNYNLNFAKIVSQLRQVRIRIYVTYQEQEFKVRDLGANFISYVLDERLAPDGSIIREEIINWEITDIL